MVCVAEIAVDPAGGGNDYLMMVSAVQMILCRLVCGISVGSPALTGGLARLRSSFPELDTTTETA